jgi:hypothetical protein
MARGIGALGLLGIAVTSACGSSSGGKSGTATASDAGTGGDGSTVLRDGSVAPTSGCKATVREGADVRPQHRRRRQRLVQLSPAVVDLDHDGHNEIVAPLGTFVFDDKGTWLATQPRPRSRRGSQP